MRYLRRCFILAILVSSMATQMASEAADPSWTALYQRGEEEIAKQKLETAETYFRSALKAAQSQSKNTQDTEKCMLKLADTLALRDKTDEAQALYQKLLDILVKRYGRNSSQIAPVLLALGSIQESEGDHTTAIEYYQRALAINEKNYGPYSPAVAGSLHHLGRANFKKGNKPLAEKHYKQALSILSNQASLSASSELQSLMHDYGDLLKGNDQSNQDLIKDFQSDVLGDPSKKGAPPPSGGWNAPPANTSNPPSSSSSSSSAFQTQSDFQLNASKQSQSDEDPKIVLRGISQPASDATLAPAFKVMNDTLFKQNHYQKGEEYYKRMIATDVDALGPNHPSVANDLKGLAQLYIAGHKYADAKPLLTRALGIYTQAYGDNNLLAINTRISLALVEFHIGNVEEAAKLYRSALNNGQSTLAPNSIETARLLNDLAYLYFHQGKLQDACTFYEWAVASTEGAVGKNDPLLAACLKDYAQVLRGLGRTVEAANVETRAAGILANAQPATELR